MSPYTSTANKKMLRRARRRDRIARWVITVGGIAIIGTVILMLVLILRVAIPLFLNPSATKVSEFSQHPLVSGEPLAVGLDDYLETAYTMDREGAVSFYGAVTGELRETIEIAAPAPNAKVLSIDTWEDHDHALLWDTGDVSVHRVRFVPVFDGPETREITYVVDELKTLPRPEDAPINPEGTMVRVVETSAEDKSAVRVDLTEDNRLLVYQEVTEETLFDVETTTHTAVITPDESGEITKITLDSLGETLYAVTSENELIRWSLREPGAPELLGTVATNMETPVTALSMVFGDVSLAVGDAGGGLSTWFPVPQEDTAETQLALIHALPSHNAAVRYIDESRRNKSLLSIDADGIAQLSHMTSERHLLTFADEAPIRLAGLSNRANGLVAFREDGRLAIWRVDNPHPEISWRTLFGKVWYENYPEPAYTWQSSASSDDFEPKLSLVPLIFGSFKGTVYAMIFAIPLALFGAVYTSQFTTPRFRDTIKPIVEIMAAIPSVVIGFLIALWLAPILENFLMAFFISLLMIPLMLLLFIALWMPIAETRIGRRLTMGVEFLLLIPVFLFAWYIAAQLGPVVENQFFDGNIKQWLFDEFGTRYDQRNAIIIAFGLGFAVIPIIFTISEDALSNVPSTLKAASLALGASRWQTVWRVVLPSASPGIFAAIIIGFGRAVGETMIVLMATGNTPILDWSPFNGMRTLSANIAVEIPEAPQGGTLYRVLFLSAVLLFLLTSALNTIAELTRQRLRKKYGQFQ